MIIMILMIIDCNDYMYGTFLRIVQNLLYRKTEGTNKPEEIDLLGRVKGR